MLSAPGLLIRIIPDLTIIDSELIMTNPALVRESRECNLLRLKLFHQCLAVVCDLNCFHRVKKGAVRKASRPDCVI